MQPYVPPPAEAWIQRIQRTLYNPTPPAVVPFIGSLYPGGGLALGPKYVARYADSGIVQAHAAWSFRNYLGANASLVVPDLASGRVKVVVDGNWLRAPSVSFFGVGPDSRSSERATYRYVTTGAAATVRVAPVRFAGVGGGAEYLDVQTGGTNNRSIEALFSPDSAPGLGADVRYVIGRAFAEIDWRESPGYTTSGGLYRVDWSRYGAGDGAPFSFTRVDAEVDQFIPLLRANWVIALRAMASTTEADRGHEIPHFMMPALGGGSELRGYPSWRFRDRHRMLLSAEYRWTAGQFVDMALFLDAGKVAARRADLDFNDLNSSYGLGMRVHTPAATALRIEIAKTRDAGIGFVFTFGPSF